MRAAGDPASWISTPRMQGIAQRMLDLTFQDTGEGSAEAAGDARFFAASSPHHTPFARHKASHGPWTWRETGRPLRALSFHCWSAQHANA